MKLLVVGGTRLLGRALVETAREHGHDVTLFHRGLTNSSLFAGLRRLRGDRVRDASLLAGEPFDMVVDVAGYLPMMSPPWSKR
jgi:2'-hydroxyisoflavone reductase